MHKHGRLIERIPYKQITGLLPMFLVLVTEFEAQMRTAKPVMKQ